MQSGNVRYGWEIGCGLTEVVSIVSPVLSEQNGPTYARAIVKVTSRESVYAFYALMLYRCMSQPCIPERV